MAQSAAGGLGVPFRQLSVHPHADPEKVSALAPLLAVASSMRYSDFVPNVLQTSCLISILDRDKPLCTLLDYYNIKRVHITSGTTTRVSHSRPAFVE